MRWDGEIKIFIVQRKNGESSGRKELNFSFREKMPKEVRKELKAQVDKWGKRHNYYKGEKLYDDDETDIRALVPQWPEIVEWKVWRPNLNETHYAVLEAALKMDCTVDEACALAGIARATYYKYAKQYEWFKVRMQRAIDYPKILARAAVQNQIWKWDGKLALKYLQLRDSRLKESWPIAEETEQTQAPVVQFISVAPTNKWIDNQDRSQSDIEPKSASDTSVTILENNVEERKTKGIWENEAEILERLNWVTSRSE